MKIEYSKGGNIEYRIDEENRTVKAILYCSYRDPQMLFDKVVKNYIKGNGTGPVAVGWDNEKYYINDYYVGKAKCHPDDTFDVEFGKRLALARVKQKYQRAVNKSIFNMHNYVYKLYKAIFDYSMKHYRKDIDYSCALSAIESEKRNANESIF